MLHNRIDVASRVPCNVNGKPADRQRRVEDRVGVAADRRHAAARQHGDEIGSQQELRHEREAGDREPHPPVALHRRKLLVEPRIEEASPGDDDMRIVEPCVEVEGRRCRMIPAHQDPVVFLKQQFPPYRPVAGRDDRDGEIATPADERLRGAGRGWPGQDREIDARRSGGKFLQEVGQRKVHQHVRHQQRHRLAHGLQVDLARCDEGGDGGEYLLDRLVHRLGSRCQPHGAADALQQRIGKEMPAAAERCRCRGLGEPDAPCRARDAPLLDQGIEDDEEVEIDGTQIHPVNARDTRYRLGECNIVD